MRLLVSRQNRPPQERSHHLRSRHRLTQFRTRTHQAQQRGLEKQRPQNHRSYYPGKIAYRATHDSRNSCCNVLRLANYNPINGEHSWWINGINWTVSNISEQVGRTTSKSNRIYTSEPSLTRVVSSGYDCWGQPGQPRSSF